MNSKKSVLDYFYEICSVPHGSGNTGAVAEYCAGIAKEFGLWYRKDEFDNVVIKKEASADKKASEPVIIQGHLDMVCAKTENSDFDFMKDSIKCITEGDFLRADCTTLGADNGIAVAYALALISDDTISHPPLEIILTSDEEIGMIGANKLDISDIESRRLINIDSEEEGVFTVSCAGGARVNMTFKAHKADVRGTKVRMTVSGLVGGHSGTEIHKGGKNANKIMGEILSGVCQEYDINLVSVNGGDKDNAIAVNAESVFVVKDGEAQAVERLASDMFEKIKSDSPADKDMRFTFDICTSFSGQAESCEFSKNISDALCNVINGVVAMDENTEGLVKTSLNLGVVRTSDSGTEAVFAVRSNDNAELDRLVDDLSAFAQSCGAAFETGDRYPAWEYVRDSYLRDVMIDVYKDKYGKSPEVTALHAGLECGVFAGKLGTLDAVSIGPEMYDVHTVRERVSISSVNRVWEFLKAVLAKL